MTCKDAINSDASSEDKKLYFLSESTKYNKIFESNLEGTIDHDEKANQIHIWNEFNEE